MFGFSATAFYFVIFETEHPVVVLYLLELFHNIAVEAVC